jgi:Na+/phosphate symporter
MVINSNNTQASMMVSNANKVDTTTSINPPVVDKNSAQDSVEFSDMGKDFAQIDSLSKGIEDIYSKHLSKDEIKEINAIFEKLDNNPEGQKDADKLSKRLDSLFEKAESSMSKEEKAKVSALDTQIQAIESKIEKSSQNRVEDDYNQLSIKQNKEK